MIPIMNANQTSVLILKIKLFFFSQLGWPTKTMNVSYLLSRFFIGLEKKLQMRQVAKNKTGIQISFFHQTLSHCRTFSCSVSNPSSIELSLDFFPSNLFR